MKYYLVVAVLAVLIACTRDADVKIPAQKPALVVHGYIAVDDTFSVSLGRTMNMNEQVNPALTMVSDGWIVIYENDVFADSLRFDPVSGNYTSSLKAKQGKTYKLVAGAPGFVNVEATGKAPLPSATLSITHTLNARTSSVGVSLDDIKFKFTDPAAEDNYYIAALYTAVESPLCVYTYDPVIEKNSSALIPFDQGNCTNSDQILFTDKIFNGGTREITISGSSDELKTYTDPVTGQVQKPFLKRYNVSQVHYNYFKNSLVSDQNAVPTFSNPVTVKGNIKNGFGLFSVFNLTTDTLP